MTLRMPWDDTAYYIKYFTFFYYMQILGIISAHFLSHRGAHLNKLMTVKIACLLILHITFTWLKS